MAKPRSGSIQQRGHKSFRIRYVNADGIRQEETIRGDPSDAQRELQIRIGEIAKGLPISSKPNTVLFGELANDVLTDYEVNGFTSIDDAETRYRLHLIPIFGKRKASQITTAQIRSYILSRQKEEAKPGTINRELELMRHTFNLAKEGRKLFTSPHVPKLREDNARSGFFTREEVDRLCSHLVEPYASFVLFAFLTGWRYSEIQGLKWSNVNFTAGEIRLNVGTTKTREGRVFPMSKELRILLNKLAASAQTTRTKSAGVVTMTPMAAHAERVFKIGSFRKSWKTACHKAGVPCVVEPVKKGGKKGAVKILSCSRTPHDLRRSCVKNLIAQGIPERVIMQMCGWKTRSVLDRYHIVGEADLRTAREKMDAKWPDYGANISGN